MSELKVKLARSHIGCTPKQRKTLLALGLKHRETVRTYPDNAAVRGMLNSVSHLVEVSEL